MEPNELTEEQAEAIAAEFDTQRDCWWNHNTFTMSELYRIKVDGQQMNASQTTRFKSLGGQCWGTLLEIALMHTLRRCKDCGSDHLFVAGYRVSCSACFACNECEDCEDGGCFNVAENANLQDAVTAWNLSHGDNGPRGQVIVCGGG